MARSSKRRKRDYAVDDEGLNLTALIDVLFNLIFFFVIATDIRSGGSYFNLKLPQASRAPATQVQKKIPEVSVAKDGRLALNGEEITAEDLPAKLKAAVAAAEVERVVLSADGEATVQQSVAAMDLIRAAGIEEVIQKVAKKQ